MQLEKVGDENSARIIAEGHYASDEEYLRRRDLGEELLPEWIEQIGAGSQRTIYLDHDTQVVYKIGHDSANRHEVRMLGVARERGADYAPDATLYEINGVTVVAMPYLPDDGSMGDDQYPIFPEACDLNPDNIHAHAGQYWLIDAGGM